MNETLHREAGPATGGTRPLVRRLAFLGLALVFLYYLTTSVSLIRELHHDLEAAQSETRRVQEQAVAERAELERRLDDLQRELEQARAEVQSLRDQLEQAGVTPIAAPGGHVTLGWSSGAQETENAAPGPSGGPTEAPATPTPTPEPAQPPAEGGTPLLCILTLCL